jgi:hypothetical protein
MLALQNTQHFEEKKGDIAPCLKKISIYIC